MEGNSLAVGGTTGNDMVTLTPADATGDITVNVNGTTTFNGVSLFKPTDHILVYGQSGNDTIQLVSNRISGTTYYLTVSAFLYGGGTGNEILSVAGSTANNVVIGGGGTNQITGGLGRDLLIAGLGASKLFAGSGGAILIGGWTDYDLTSTALTYDKKLAALEAIMAEWGSADSYATRVNDLSNGGGLNGTYRLNASTVHDNGQVDTLTGITAATPLDWFFASTTDLFKHKNPGEVVATIS
jgi:Ca2+-binding RTX toxin-like protein